MLILFYGNDSVAGKARMAAMKAEKASVRLYHSIACQEAEHADGIEFMPDVPADERARLEALFGFAGHRQPPFAPPAPVAAEKPADMASLAAGKGPGGRWYVKRGKEIVSGPYPTEDAASAAAMKAG